MVGGGSSPSSELGHLAGASRSPSPPQTRFPHTHSASAPARSSRAASAASQLCSGRDLCPVQRNTVDLYIFSPIKPLLGVVYLRRAGVASHGEEESPIWVLRVKPVCWAEQGVCGHPPAPLGGRYPPPATPTVGQLLIVPCQIDLQINEFAGTLLLLPVRGKSPYFKWEKVINTSNNARGAAS